MSLEQHTLLSLAESIAENAKNLTELLKQESHPLPTFRVDGPTKFPAGEGNKIQDVRMKLLTATLAMEQLTSGPEDYMVWNNFTAKHDIASIYTLSEFNVFQAIPEEGSITYDELAQKVPELTKTQLRRLIRVAMARNIFTAPELNAVAHNAFSIVFVRKPALNAWVAHNVGEVAPGALRLPDVIRTYGDSQDPAESGMTVAHNLPKGLGLFEWFKTDGEGEQKGFRARRFAKTMECMDAGGHNLEFVDRGFDWESLGDATIVDLGGSVGHLSIALARKHPRLKFVVQDLPELEAPFQGSLPSDVSDRVSFQAHDFTTPQPRDDVDVFVLRHVLHDWPNAVALNILRNVVNGAKGGILKPGTRVIIIDGVMPPVGVIPQPLDRVLTAMDMQMWCGMNALERTREDWEGLFGKADPRFEVKAFVTPQGSTDTVIEVVFQG